MKLKRRTGSTTSTPGVTPILESSSETNGAATTSDVEAPQTGEKRPDAFEHKKKGTFDWAIGLDAQTTIERGFGAALAVVDDVIVRVGLGDVVFGDGREAREALTHIRARVKEMLAAGVDGLEVQRTFQRAVEDLFFSFAQDAVREVGTPPCGFSLVGLGSFGRGELAPYSDLDYGIVVRENTDEAMSWARRFSDALDRRVKQLHESCISNHGIESCRNLSPTGLSGDALVGTARMMANHYVDAKAKTREVRAVLIDARAIFGVPSLARDVRRDVSRIVRSEAGRAQRDELLHTLARGTPDRVNVDSTSIDPKEDLMRAYQLPLIGFDLLLGLRGTSAAERIDELMKRGVLGVDEGAALLEAVSFSLQVRIQNHLAAGRPDDSVVVDDALKAELAVHGPVLSRFAQRFKDVARDPDAFLASQS